MTIACISDVVDGINEFISGRKGYYNLFVKID